MQTEEYHHNQTLILPSGSLQFSRTHNEQAGKLCKAGGINTRWLVSGLRDGLS